MSILKMSFYGGVMILVIIILRGIFKNRLPKRTFVILWGVVLLRLLVPFSVPSVFSVYSVAGWQENAGIDNAFYYNTGENGPTTIFNAGAVDTQMLFPVSGDSDGDMRDSMDEGEINVITFVRVIQYSGTAVCISVFLTLYLCCLHMFHSALPVHNEYIRRWEREHQQIRPVLVRQSDRVSTPLTYGIFKPVILLPKELEWETGGKLEYILQHEYCHICKFDAARKLLMAAAVCVHWFNPLVWIMYFLMCRDIELACDEEVLRYFGRDARKNYALILIGMEEKNSRFTAIYNGFGKTAIEERVRSIMKYKRATLFTIVSAAVIIIIVVCMFATSGKGEQRVNEPVVAGDSEGLGEIGSVPFDPPKGNMISGKGAEENSFATASEGGGDYADSDYILDYTLEGIHEQEAAALYAGDGYHIIIPAEGWKLYAPDAWMYEKNESIQIWVTHFDSKNSGQVIKDLEADGYAVNEADGIQMQKDVDGQVFNVEIRQSGEEIWGVFYTYLVEAVEGVGGRLPVIASTFEILSDENEVLSENEKEITKVAEGFWAAYLSADEGKLKQYLTENYEFDIDFFPDGRDGHIADEAELLNIKIPDGERTDAKENLEISLEFRPSADLDYLEYLTMELVREKDGWKVCFYGLEM